MGNLKPCHNKVRVSLADLFQNDPGVNQESKETALISNQSTLEFGSVGVRDRTGREAALQYALLRGEKGSAILTVFDTGATRSISRSKLKDGVRQKCRASTEGAQARYRALREQPEQGCQPYGHRIQFMFPM